MAVGITLAILFCFGIVGLILTKLSRNRQYKQDAAADRSEEEGRLSTLPKQIPSKPPQLPVFKTRSSLSMSSKSNSPKSPKSPGIRFTITSPSHRSRRSASIDSLPSVETVLEKYEREEDAKMEEVKADAEKEGDGKLTGQDLGEPGPAVSSANSESEVSVVTKSMWDRPSTGLGRLREALESEAVLVDKI